MKKNKVLVDILLPYWGDVRLFRKTVESIQAQANPYWRLLIFDDHYPSDDAQIYVKSLTDDRIIYYRHKRNIGITANFNFALSKARAPYCVLIGCDDIMLPNYIKRALTMIGEADFYQPGVHSIDREGRVYHPLTDRVKLALRPSKPGIYSGQSLATSLCYGNWLYFPSILWRTDTIKKYYFDDSYKIAEDLDLELKVISNGGTLFLDNEVSFQYRRFADSLSSKEKGKSGVRFTEEVDVYNKAARSFRALGWHKAARAARMRITSRINQLLN